ncbi:MAG TPA: hypothetical protein DHW79_02470, partial [Candidatus Cloacimonas sp.]|nr:hypothetical protein [Candidatus Cloacimonas sp.]
EQIGYKLINIINPVRLSAKAMIGSVLCPCRIILKVLAHIVIKAQEPLSNAVVSSFLKHLFPPTTPQMGLHPIPLLLYRPCFKV